MEWYGESTVSLVNHRSITSLREGVAQRLKHRKTITWQLKNAILIALQDALVSKKDKGQ